jgi:monoamine oxidase
VIHASHRIRFGAPLDQQQVGDLDVSFGEFLSPLKLVRSVHEYLSAWAGFFFGCDATEVSALHVLSWVAGFDNSAWAWYAAIADKFERGTKSLVDALAADAEADMLLSSPVERVVQEPDGVRVITRSGESFAASAAILSTPLNTWRDIEFTPALSDAKAAAAKERHTGHSVKVWALVRDAPPGLVGVGFGGGLSWLSSEDKLPEGDLLVGFGVSPERLDLSSRADVQSAIQAFAPQARVLKFDGHDWNGDEFSQGTWMAFQPGQVMRFHSAFQQTEGRLAFAGSDLALGWAGWIDGAIESGARAARHTAEIVGRSTVAAP